MCTLVIAFSVNAYYYTSYGKKIDVCKQKAAGGGGIGNSPTMIWDSPCILQYIQDVPFGFPELKLYSSGGR